MAEYPRQEPSSSENPAENVQVDDQAAQNAAQHGPRTEHAPTQHGPDLAKVIDAWGSLTSEARKAILEIVAGKPDLKPHGL
jgi:hypothetical protein